MDGGLDDEWEDAHFIADLIRTAEEPVASRRPVGRGSAGMDGGLDDELEADASFIAELIRTVDEAVASSNPNPTATPTPAPAPIRSYAYGPFAATPVSYLPASSASYLPAASHRSPPPRFSPPRELSQRPPLPPPPTADASAARDARDFSPPPGFSPPRELSQRPAPEEGSLAIVPASGSAGDHRLVGTGVGAKRDREARELKRLKRELNRVTKQMNELENECTELKRDRTKKDLLMKAKEAEIQNLKKANVSSGKDVCSAGMVIDQSFHAPANGALHVGRSSRTSTRRTDKMNGKDKDVHCLRDDFYLKQGQQTDLPETLELRHCTMIDNGISTSGVVSPEVMPLATHFEEKPPPVENTLLCTLEELYNGTKRKMEITRIVAKPDGRVEVETEVLAVEVLPGWKRGTKITFPNKGDKLHGHLAQDLTFVLDSKPHDVYNLEGNNLVVKQVIPLVDALTGAEINLRTLDGRNLPVRVEDVVCPGYKVVLENEGWPIRKEPGKKGKMVIKFDVTFPVRLSSSQRTGIRRILGG